MTQANPLRVPFCRAGRITDDVLERIAQVAHKAQDGITLSDAEAALMLITAPQICNELRHRRAAMDLISDCTDLDNVRFLPASAG